MLRFLGQHSSKAICSLFLLCLTCNLGCSSDVPAEGSAPSTLTKGRSGKDSAMANMINPTGDGKMDDPTGKSKVATQGSGDAK